MPTRTPDADPAALHRPASGPGDEDEARVAPEIPSLASLRDPRRRSAVDLLVPAAPAPAGPAPLPPGAAAPGAAPRPVGPPRPPEWGDLWHLGVHVGRSLAGVPARVVRRQARCLRAILGR